ncbi:site-specific integrase [Photobacterium lipolyticum]|uniref:Core-binding (CB) domain-containing protein n=1 Tax=Photobacterium lipolyticum TaxID=266810 RepID=A0A2T3MQQ4_9GAMM|nr:site-specific integrase [Photobacterium lipolyticum]PSV99562.1 hypothetical protein C9I89_21670 [Photobacterium lipolyticum]
MIINVKQYRFNGRSFVSLVDSDCCPVCPYAVNYINVRLSGKAFNTRVTYSHELKFVLTYFSYLPEPIDLVQRVATGRFLNRGELNAFVSAARFKNESELSNIVSIKHFSDKTLENAIHATYVSSSSVKAATAQKRIGRLREFLEYLYDQLHSDFAVLEEVAQRSRQLDTALRDAQRNITDFDDACVAFTESVIPDEVFFRLLKIIQPESPNNPFKHSKRRNHLILSIFIHTGLRRGAVAKLKIEHCKFWGSFDEIAVTRKPRRQIRSAPFSSQPENQSA